MFRKRYLVRKQWGDCKVDARRFRTKLMAGRYLFDLLQQPGWNVQLLILEHEERWVESRPRTFETKGSGTITA